MRLQYNCTSCRNTNYFRPVVATRGDLQMKMGDEVEVKCEFCKEMQKKHINKITAVADKRMLIVGGILGLVSAIILWLSFGAIGVVTAVVPILIGVYESNAANSFNKYMIRRK